MEVMARWNLPMKWGNGKIKAGKSRMASTRTKNFLLLAGENACPVQPVISMSGIEKEGVVLCLTPSGWKTNPQTGKGSKTH